ncbi:MAG: HAD family hydrolase [Pseudomonadota bacterium]
MSEDRRRAVFFDRDGTLNIDHGYVGYWRDFQWTDGAVDAIAWLNQRDILAIVVTNQSGVARGFFNEDDVNALHARMNADLQSSGAAIDAFYFCPYHRDAASPQYRHPDHDDRKPNPGMLMKATQQFDINLSRSLLVGDQESDMAAARAAGVRGALFTGETPLLELVVREMERLKRGR